MNKEGSKYEKVKFPNKYCFQFCPHFISIKDVRTYSLKDCEITFKISKDNLEKNLHTRSFQLYEVETNDSISLKSCNFNFGVVNHTPNQKQTFLIKIFLFNKKKEEKVWELQLEASFLIKKLENEGKSSFSRIIQIGDLLIDFDIYCGKNFKLIQEVPIKQAQDRQHRFLNKIKEKLIKSPEVKQKVPEKIQQQDSSKQLQLKKLEKEIQTRKEEKQSEESPIQDLNNRSKLGEKEERIQSEPSFNESLRKDISSSMKIELNVLEKLRIEGATSQFEDNVKQYIKKLHKIVNSLPNKMREQKLLYQDQIEELKNQIKDINVERYRESLRLKKLISTKQDQIKMYKQQIQLYKKEESQNLQQLINQITKRQASIDIDNQLPQKLKETRNFSNKEQTLEMAMQHQFESKKEKETLIDRGKFEGNFATQDITQFSQENSRINQAKSFLSRKPVGSANSRFHQRK